MKKVYLQPSVKTHAIKLESCFLAGSEPQKGDGNVYYGGGEDGDDDNNGGEGVGGTGDGTGFTQG